MKPLLTILLLTSSLAMFGQDYATSEAELKQRKKSAKEQMLISVSMMALGFVVKTNDQVVHNREEVVYAAGAVTGVGLAIGVDAAIDLIEIGKEERGKRKARNNKKQD